MNKKPSIIITLAMAILAAFAFSPVAQAQDGNELLNQLTGNAEAPTRNAAQLTEAYENVIDYLLPLMTETSRAQYDWHIAFQNLGSYASRPGAETERKALSQVMINYLEEKEMPLVIQNWFVLQLERIGKAESVPGLAKLLKAENVHLRDYARTALEKNPDASATDALLKELDSANESSWKIGLLNSLGQRKAGSAVSTIAKALNDSDAKVASAAVTALTVIGDQASIQALTGVLNKPTSSVYVKAGQGLIDIAQAKALNNQTEDAGKIFDSIYETTSKQASGAPDTTGIRIAAINGMINASPEKGATLIANFIRDDNPRIRAAAVMGARLSPSDEPAKALSKILTQLEPDAQVQVLGLIGERKDLSSIDAVKETLSSRNSLVRLASIDTMSKLGDAASAEALFNIAVNGAGQEKTAAHSGLVQMPGTNVEILLSNRSQTGEVPSRVEAITLIGEKQMTDSAATLLEIASENNARISAAALKALGQVGDESNISEIINLMSKSDDEDTQQSGTTAIKAILSRAEDKDAAAQQVIDSINKAEGQLKIALLTSLNAAGGSKALAAVTEASKSSDETMKDQAIRTLCAWPDYDAAKVLLSIVSNQDSSLVHHVLSIRSILQLIQESSDVSVDDRADVCLATYDSARRNEEKGQIISAMATLQSTKISDKLLEIAKGDELQDEAALAALSLASSMARSNGQASQALAQQVLDMNISEDINTQAQSVISGRGNRGRGNFGNLGNRGNRNQRGARSVIVRPDKDARLASINEIETQIEALKAAIAKAPDKDPDFASLEGDALTEAIEAMQPENDAITAIQTTLASLRGDTGAGARGGNRGGMMGMGGNTPSEDLLSELRVIANGENATKTVARLDALIKEAQTQSSTRGGMNFQGMGGARGGNRGMGGRGQ